MSYFRIFKNYSFLGIAKIRFVFVLQNFIYTVDCTMYSRGFLLQAFPCSDDYVSKIFVFIIYNFIIHNELFAAAKISKVI